MISILNITLNKLLHAKPERETPLSLHGAWAVIF